MIDIIHNQGYLMVAAFMLCAVFQALILLLMWYTLRQNLKRHHEVSREMFGLVKRVEVLTATRRQQMLRHYDRILAKLASRLPPTVAANISKAILDTEKRVFKRLNEIEPELRSSLSSQNKINEIVKDMQCLEETIVSLTSAMVRNVMLESRADLITEERFLEQHTAANSLD